jgi:hypothetical protein
MLFRKYGFAALLIVGAATFALAPSAHAQFNIGGTRIGAVGGVKIDPDGVFSVASRGETSQSLADLRKELKAPPSEFNAAGNVRVVSLKRLESALAEALKSGEALPEEMQYLAGIQRINYIFVDEESHDILIAGPGESWKADQDGNIVGAKSGRPVVRLEDLIVALRVTFADKPEPITCSIDPTQEGVARYNQLIARGGKTDLGAIKKALGLQAITITGVPGSSRLARVLVSADYQMKRLAMNLTESPVKGMPSYMEMLAKSGGPNVEAMPRWWLACNYEPLAKSQDGLAWELRGAGVKTETGEDVYSADGSRTDTGKASPLGQKWADSMTENYDAISEKMPIFGELRNVMDLCVISALMRRENLMAKAGCELPLLTSASSQLQPNVLPVPKTTPTITSTVKKLVQASGGVQIDAFGVAGKSETVTAVSDVRSQIVAADSKQWWWAK